MTQPSTAKALAQNESRGESSRNGLGPVNTKPQSFDDERQNDKTHEKDVEFVEAAKDTAITLEPLKESFNFVSAIIPKRGSMLTPIGKIVKTVNAPLWATHPHADGYIFNGNAPGMWLGKSFNRRPSLSLPTPDKACASLSLRARGCD